MPRTSVTSSKISAILNRSPYRNAIGQYMLDTKQEKQTYSEVGRQKAVMGNKMEGLICELAEEAFKVELKVDKERYMHNDYDFFRIEFDALDEKNKIIYEFKNTEMEEDKLYELYYPQVQFAMFIKGWDYAKIVYLRNGWNLGYIDVTRDDNFITHMVEAGIYYWECLTTLTEPSLEYLDSIVNNIEFYKEMDAKRGEDAEADLTTEDLEKMYEWGRLKKEIQTLNIEDKRYKGYFAEKYGKFKDELVTFSNVEQTRKGNIDVEKLQIDYPAIDLDRYRKPQTKYQRISLRYRAPAEEQEVTINKQEDLV